MLLESHFPFLKESISAAEQAMMNGNHPFGAVLVANGKILIRAENLVHTSNDCTQHAELVLVQKAVKAFDRSFLRKSTLYASTEPCAMCSGAIYWSGIRTVVFGCSVSRLAHFTTGSFVISCRSIFSQGRQSPQVIGPLLEKEAEKAHAIYWQSKRQDFRELEES